MKEETQKGLLIGPLPEQIDYSPFGPIRGMAHDSIAYTNCRFCGDVVSDMRLCSTCAHRHWDLLLDVEKRAWLSPIITGVGLRYLKEQIDLEIERLGAVAFIERHSLGRKATPMEKVKIKFFALRNSIRRYR